MMLEKIKLGQSEAIALIATAISTKVFLAYPAIIAGYGGSAAWMIVLLSGLITLFFFSFIAKFLERFPNQSFPEIVENVTGQYFGVLIVIAVLFPWLFDLSLGLRRFSEMIIIVALPETPISIITLTLVFAAGVVAYLGIKTIAGACYLSFPFALGAILLIVLLTYPSWNLDWLFPPLGKGISQILTYGTLCTSDFIELNFLYLLPLIFYSRQIKSIGYKSIVISMLIFLTMVLTYTLTFPSVIGEEPYLPLYKMARSVYLGRFLQRIEAIFVFFWVFSGYLWEAAGIYGFCYVFTNLLKLPDYRPLILPTIIIMCSLAFIPSSLPDTVLIANNVFGEFAFIPFFGIPALLLILAIIRKKGDKAGVKK
ncbi:GerAB/ArcD/ProY family transporter [Desulfolucanica intricata]|uniref:GerAB/ArcD/ProY family transporter n=1 Tax=Desulfolucanica intricata TaxID=1285191 RepID=UPI0008312583|nr:endospore germination permease [Desulfolucanica intricata]